MAGSTSSSPWVAATTRASTSHLRCRKTTSLARRRASGEAMKAIVVAFAAALALLQGTRTVWDGVYTEEQATRGAGLFDRECAGCHGPDGEGGGMAPALAGPAFYANYDGQTVGDLYERNRTT